MNLLNQKLASLRSEYRYGDDSGTVDYLPDPYLQFEKWMTEAIDTSVPIPNAMHLSTTGKNGRPSGRIVLLHGLEEKDFIFYSNYESKKGIDLEENPFASLTFFWNEMYRQVRIEGEVFRLSEKASEEYFRSRPRGSQISALASLQSKILESRESLVRKTAELDEKYRDQPIPKPPGWGGYRLKPDQMEFWQGMPARLHDRVQYILENDSWIINRLYP